MHNAGLNGFKSSSFEGDIIKLRNLNSKTNTKYLSEIQDKRIFQITDNEKTDKYR